MSLCARVCCIALQASTTSASEHMPSLTGLSLPKVPLPVLALPALAAGKAAAAAGAVLPALAAGKAVAVAGAALPAIAAGKVIAAAGVAAALVKKPKLPLPHIPLPFLPETHQAAASASTAATATTTAVSGAPTAVSGAAAVSGAPVASSSAAAAAAASASDVHPSVIEHIISVVCTVCGLFKLNLCVCCNWHANILEMLSAPGGFVISPHLVHLLVIWGLALPYASYGVIAVLAMPCR